MAKYKLEIKSSAVKEIKKLPNPDLKRVLAKIDALAEDPSPPDSVKFPTMRNTAFVAVLTVFCTLLTMTC